MIWKKVNKNEQTNESDTTVKKQPKRSQPQPPGDTAESVWYVFSLVITSSQVTLSFGNSLNSDPYCM